MGDIGDQLRFHPLAPDLLADRLLKSLLNFSKLFLIGCKHAPVLAECRTQISLCDGIRGLKEPFVLLPDIPDILSDRQIQKQRIGDQQEPAKDKAGTDQRQNHIVDHEKLYQNFIRTPFEIRMEHLLT